MEIEAQFELPIFLVTHSEKAMAPHTTRLTTRNPLGVNLKTT